MVALGVDMQTPPLRDNVVLKPPGQSCVRVASLGHEECVVTQEQPLSTSTVASSHVASISSAEGEEDDEEKSDGEDNTSEDADDEASEDDVMGLMWEEEEETKPTTVQNPEDRTSTGAELSEDDADTTHSPALPAPVRFSLISIPSRVRASVFARKPRVIEADPSVRESSEAKPDFVSLERESTLDTASPSSAYAGLTMPSLTSFTSLTKTFSQRTLDEEKPSQVENVEKFKSFWDDKLRSAVDRIAHRTKAEAGTAVYEHQRAQLDVFHLLLKLYAHQDVIEELYASYFSNATEFEFYIPQLCTFFLHGNYEKQHQLECFLMSRSGESLVFAHRLGWFLKSFCGDGRGYQSEYLSVTSSPEEENADLLNAIQQRGGVPAVLMEQGLNIEEVAEPGPNLLLRRASSFDIDAAALETITKASTEDDASFAAYLQRKRNLLMYEAMPEEGNEQQIALYNATPSFIAELTDLADRLIPVSLADRNAELRRQLADISEKSLPSNVIYLPIGNSYHRVKGLKIDECFTFSTKERVPYFLCVEVIDYSVRADAEEVKLQKTPLVARRRPKKFGIKLRFKKTRDPLAITVASRKSDLTSIHDVYDDFDMARTPGVPHELLYEEETKINDDIEFRPSINVDILDANVLALTPGHSPRKGDIGNDEAEHDGDDEKEKTQESTDSEQKNLLGQWGLPRVRRRSKAARSSAPKASSTFDSFYSSWFAKKQKIPGLDDPAMSPVTMERRMTECAIVTPLMTDSNDNQADVSDGEEVDQSPVQSELFGSETNEPSPEPKVDVTQPQVVESSEDEIPQRRCRDISVSLDFTDSDAWKVNFDLDDALTDVEPELITGATAPEMTPEADHGDADNNDNEVDEEDGEGDGEEFEDEKPIIVFRERWSEKEDRIRKESPLGVHPGWRLLPVIVKSNDDLRQEQFAAQLIAQCDRIFKGYSLPLQLRPYNVIATSAKSGLIEAVPNTVSLDSLKRNDPHYTTLLDFFERLFGSGSAEFRRARRNFVESLAAYSILCYVLQIKDRHNGNILLDTDGHVIHIDFGFLLTNSPGSNLNFEKAPFKLTDEFVELMGGSRSPTFRYFRSLCIRAYLALRRNIDKIVLLVEMMLVGNEDLPCFAGGKRVVIEGLKERLKPGARTSECQLFVNQLIDRSTNNWRTRWYDKYQRAWVGIL